MFGELKEKEKMRKSCLGSVSNPCDVIHVRKVIQDKNVTYFIKKNQITSVLFSKENNNADIQKFWRKQQRWYTKILKKTTTLIYKNKVCFFLLFYFLEMYKIIEWGCRRRLGNRLMKIRISPYSNRTGRNSYLH